MSTDNEPEDTVVILEPTDGALEDETGEQAGAAEGALTAELVGALLEAQERREAQSREEAAALAAERISGVIIGRVVRLTELGPLVRYRGCPSLDGLVARAAAVVTEADVGRRAALLFEDGDVSRPLLTGLLHFDDEREGDHPARPSLEVREDEHKLDIRLNKAISLRCGKATIIITPAGKIVLRGKYVLSRASGVNRIQGGGVRIN